MATRPPPLLLWSAGNVLKYKINERYFGYHYVWCSPVFDAAAASRYAVGAGQPPSSDPASIYRALHADVSRKDRHSNEIARQRDGIKATALMLSAKGAITADEAAEIAIIVDTAETADWAPLIYVIPYDRVVGRVQSVPLDKRASIEPEYVIPDLKSAEFHTIEPIACHSTR